MTKTQQDPADSSRRLRQVGFALLTALALPAFGFSEGATDSVPRDVSVAEGASVPAPTRKPGPGNAPPEAVLEPRTMSASPTQETAALPAVEAPNYEMDEDSTGRGFLGSLEGGIGSVGRSIFPWLGGPAETAALGTGMLIESVTGEDADTAQTLSLVDAQGF